MVDDAVLLSRYAAAGDEAAFAEFVGRHIDSVYSSALRRVGGDRHFAEDVTQQVFFAVAGNAARVAAHPMITGWLFTTTRNIALQLVRTERRRKAREQDALTRDDQGASGADANGPGVARFLEQALDQLNAKDRTAILLRFMHRQAYADIGRSLQLSEDAARMRVERAMHKLRALLERHGVKSSAAAIGAAMTAHAAGSAPSGLAATITSGALAGAKVAGATSAWGGVSLLAGSKAAWGGMGLALVAALTYGVLNGVRASRADHGNLGLVREREHLLATQRHFEQRARQAEARLQTLQSPLDVSPGGEGAAGGAPVATPRQGVSALDPGNRATKQISDAITHALHTDPELLRLRIEDSRNRLRVRYGPLYHALQLTPAQVEEFEALLARRAEAGLRLMAEKFHRGLAEDSAEHLALKRRHDVETNAPIDASLRTLLGAAGYAGFQQYERLAPARPVADSLAAALYFTATPLTGPQSVELAKWVPERGGQGAGLAGWTDATWEEFLTRAHTVLQPEQVAMLHALRQQADGQRRMAERRETLRLAIIDAALDQEQAATARTK